MTSPTRLRQRLPFSGALTACVALATGTVDWLELPAGPARGAVAAVAPDTQPHSLPPEFSGDGPLAGDDLWSRPATWELWARWLGELHDTPGATDDLRARLALLSLAQGRGEDAWRHVAACRDASWVAALAARLLPGIPVDCAIGPGGLPGGAAALPDGVLLRPVLPPVTGRGAHSTRVNGLRIGAGIVDLELTLEAGGVQVDVVHVSGGTLRLDIVLPEPNGQEIRIEYVDWMRQDTLREPLRVALQPGSEPITLFGRFRPRDTSWPSGAAARVPEALRRGGLRLELPADDPERELFEAIAANLSGLLAIPVRVVGPQPGETSAWSGTRMRLGSGAERQAKLAWLVTSIEGFLVGGGN